MTSSRPAPIGAAAPVEQALAAPRSERTPAQIDAICEAYAHLPALVAAKVHRRSFGGIRNAEIDEDECAQDGFFGLRDAARTFDPTVGVKFPTHAGRRITGAILDGQRERDLKPRNVRSRSSKLAAVVEQFTAERERPPALGFDADRAALAKLAGIDADELAKWIGDAAVGAVNTVSLHRRWFETDSGKDVREIDTIVDAAQRDPAELVEARLDAEAALAHLSAEQRLAWRLYHGEGIQMHSIGGALGLSESRVSQILSHLKKQLLAEQTAPPRRAADPDSAAPATQTETDVTLNPYLTTATAHLPRDDYKGPRVIKRSDLPPDPAEPAATEAAEPAAEATDATREQAAATEPVGNGDAPAAPARKSAWFVAVDVLPRRRLRYADVAELLGRAEGGTKNSLKGTPPGGEATASGVRFKRLGEEEIEAYVKADADTLAQARAAIHVESTTDDEPEVAADALAAACRVDRAFALYEVPDLLPGAKLTQKGLAAIFGLSVSVISEGVRALNLGPGDAGELRGVRVRQLTVAQQDERRAATTDELREAIDAIAAGSQPTAGEGRTEPAEPIERNSDASDTAAPSPPPAPSSPPPAADRPQQPTLGGLTAWEIVQLLARVEFDAATEKHAAFEAALSHAMGLADRVRELGLELMAAQEQLHAVRQLAAGAAGRLRVAAGGDVTAELHQPDQQIHLKEAA